MATVEFTETVRPGRKKKETPPPTDTTPEPTPDPVPTPEQLEERRQNLHKSLFGAPAPKDDLAAATPAATAEPTAEPPPAPAAAPAAATPAEPSPATQTPPEPTPAPAAATSKADIETAARAAAKLVMEEAPKPAVTPVVQPAPQPQPTFDLSPEDKADFEVVQFLERTEPGKYAGRGQPFLDYTKGFYAYQAEWEQRNPGSEFDPDSREHDAWYAKNDPGVDDTDITYGKEKMMEERIYNNRVKPEMDRMKADKRQSDQQEAIRQAQPVIIDNLQGRIVEMVKGVDEALASHITDAKGRPLLTDESIAKIDTADPIAHRVLNDVVKFQLEPMVMALELAAVEGGGYRLNPAANPAHAKISEYIDKAERDMLAAPAEVRIQNGKEFATISQFQRMQQSIRDGAGTETQKQSQLAALDDRYYTLGVDEIEAIVVEECAKTARTRIDFEDGLAKRKYGQSPASRQPEPPTPTPTPAANGGNKPNSPSISSAADTVQQRDRNTPAEKKFGEQMASVMFK